MSQVNQLTHGSRRGGALAVGLIKGLIPSWPKSLSIPCQGNLGRNEKLLYGLVQGSLARLILGCPSQAIE